MVLQTKGAWYNFQLLQDTYNNLHLEDKMDLLGLLVSPPMRSIDKTEGKIGDSGFSN